MRNLIVLVCIWMLSFTVANAQDETLAGGAPCNAATIMGNWTVPCNVTSVTVEIYGGGGGAGGGGGGSNGGLFNTRGGGGGGGGAFTTTTFNVTPGSVFSYNIGSGGCGGSNGGDGSGGGNGTAGGNSSFSGTDAGGGAVSLTANGGARGTGGSGTGGSTGSGGAGGTASGGTTNTSGGAGSSGSGGTGGNGGNGAGPGGGAGGVGSGAAGSNYGGGGAGGGDSPGGRGGTGVILITYVTTIPLPASPTVTTTPPTCTTPGSSTITNYDPSATYNFTPAGPTVAVGGAINGMVTGTSYTVTSGTGSCASAPSAPFANAAATAPPAVPVVTTTPATCSADGAATIQNYNLSLTYTFTPAGPSAGSFGAISGMVPGTSYTVESGDGSCNSGSSASFSIAAQLPVPTAAISGSLTYCTGGNTTLTASGGTNYAWTDGGGSPIGSNASVTVTQGNYTVAVTNSSGCSATATATVSEQTSLTVTITGNLDYCPGSNTTLTASGGIGYVWDDAGNSTTPSITVTAGTYTVVSSDANGCTGTASATVTALTAPVVTITGNLSYCAGTNTTITANGAIGYLWNDAANSTTPDITVTQGSYTVTGTDANTCSATASVIVSENALPTISITGSLNYCTGGNTTLTANGGTAYAWDNGATTAAVTVTQGTYNVIATDANGCTGTASVTVTESANLTVNITGILDYCPGSSTSLTATGGSSYVWSNGNTTDNVTVTQGTYTVTASDAGCSGTASALVTEFAVVPVNLGNDISLCEDSIALLDAGTGYTTYSWSSGETTQSVTPQLSGSYSVTAADANGCSVSDAVNVTYNQCVINQLFIPTAFSPNGDGSNDLFRVFGSTVRDLYFEVFNRWGELVYSSHRIEDGWDGTFKDMNAPMGVYVYQVKAVFFDAEVSNYKGSVTLLR